MGRLATEHNTRHTVAISIQLTGRLWIASSGGTRSADVGIRERERERERLGSREYVHAKTEVSLHGLCREAHGSM